MQKIKILAAFFIAFFGFAANAQTPKEKKNINPKVTDIWVVFRTHFDLGFTDLPENVFKRYREEMMDNALMLIENNEKQPKEKHFSWNVAGWPLEAQMLGPLQTPERKLRIEKAKKEGSLVADGLPFTIQTESLDYEDLVRGLGFSSAISRKYGVPLAISAKMADVPSHSWVLPTLLKNAGIQFLQLGCNPASQGDAWKKWMAEAAAEPLPPNGDYAALKNSDAHHTEVGSKRKWLRSYEDKRQYIRNTNEIVSPELHTDLDLLAASVNKEGKRVVVYNPLPWKRSGMIENPLDKEKYFYVKGVPASGYRTFSANELTGVKVTRDESSSFSTPYFKVVFDLKKGGITSLIEKSSGRELVDQSSKYVIGQFLHERFSTNEVDKWFNAYSRIKDGWGLNDLGKP